jgi:uracil-DNA glycosylase
MKTIETFVSRLTKQKNTATVSNPYLNNDIADNLRLYLSQMLVLKGKRILLVGEAPGYKGCKITGIPFTSGKAFKEIDHPLLNELMKHLKLGKLESENTASIVWNYLSTKKNIPLFWNSYPFHPHPKGNQHKNRTPTASEVSLGISYLRGLHKIYKPELVAGIGIKGQHCATKAFPNKEIQYIRHPSFGGKSEFIDGMNKII